MVVPSPTTSCLHPLDNSRDIGHWVWQLERDTLSARGGHRHPGQGLPTGVKKQMRGKKNKEKSLGDGKEDQSMKLVFCPCPGHKPLEQEMDPCSVQRKLWECPFGAGKHHNLNSVLLGRDSLSTASSEMTWRLLCSLGSPVLVTQWWVMPSPLWCCSWDTYARLPRDGLLVPQPPWPLIHSCCLLPVLAKGKAEENTGREGDSYLKPRWLS